MKNKGFTLIELLAVIVILAIIALIATPIILGIINDARTSATERTAELVKSGVQNAYTGYMMKESGNTPKKVENFVNSTFYTVESSEVTTSTVESVDNNVVITTADELTCTVTYEDAVTTDNQETTYDDRHESRVKISCDGTFADPELTQEQKDNKMDPKNEWTAAKRVYYFTSSLEAEEEAPQGGQS